MKYTDTSATVLPISAMVALLCVGCSTESSPPDGSSDGKPDIVVSDGTEDIDEMIKEAGKTKPGCVRPADADTNPEIRQAVVVPGRCAIGKIPEALACEESPAVLTVASKQDYDAVFALDCKQPSDSSPDFSTERVAFFLIRDATAAPSWVSVTTDRVVIGTTEDSSVKVPDSGFLIGFALAPSQRPVHVRRCSARCE